MEYSKDFVTKELPVNLILGEKQEDYNDLPCNFNKDTGQVTMAIELSEEEIQNVIKGGKIYIQTLTFGKPFYPIHVSFNDIDCMDAYRYNVEWLNSIKEGKK